MSRKLIASLGILANLMFWPLMFVMASVRPDYSHLHQAISELGSIGAPRMWVWNVFGYIIPGLLLAAFGWGLVRLLRSGSRTAAGLLALAGIGLALTGVFPADMDHRQSLTTSLHMAGVLMSLAAWALSLVAIAVLAWRSHRDIATVSLLALVASVGGFFLYGVMPDTPALAQRINFAVFFGWYLGVALLLLARRRSETKHPSR